MAALFICLVCSGFVFSCLLGCFVVLLIVVRIVVLLLYCLVLFSGL